jgi:hypothetical protein
MICGGRDKILRPTNVINEILLRQAGKYPHVKQWITTQIKRTLKYRKFMIEFTAMEI